MDVSPIATGFYHLEIVVDSPWMETNMSSAFMQVITLPTVEPIMIVENTLLTSNDSLKATCTVENSFPPANISWSLDNKTVNHFDLKSFIIFSSLSINRSTRFRFQGMSTCLMMECQLFQSSTFCQSLHFSEEFFFRQVHFRSKQCFLVKLSFTILESIIKSFSSKSHLLQLCLPT